ncbi:hypothetical protein [Pseudonocardia sp. WMMC193]|uniref:hypothetical protein n=1 Tax=Pseudonocardia sp. WMMC193 TaxID=2911965 RepID=UPI001F4255A2|nr:hypothetical protein [Pseudonocardia sp. WMMC193]MCF7547331.1 hypothetical protein [Pseudonocardia sp. WMMC193]
MLDPTGKINSFDRFDYMRSYVLPDTVETNIPRDRSRPGGYGAHEYARGLLVETAIRLQARPERLRYSDHEWSCTERWDICPQPRSCDAGPISLCSVTLDLAIPFTTVRVAVSWFRTAHDHHMGWRLAIDGEPIGEENRTYSPSPRYTGALVAWHHHAALEARMRTPSR